MAGMDSTANLRSDTVFSFVGKWKGSFRRLFTLLRGVLFSRLDAFSVMEVCGTARGSPRMVCRPEQAFLPGFEKYLGSTK